MQLFLIRHAQSANNALPEEQRVEDPPLTELGRRQAEALAAWIESIRLDHLIASPFRRSLETAEPIRRRIGVVPHVWVDLHEQGGCYSGYEPERYEGRPGMTRSQIAAEFPDYQLESSICERGWWKCQPYESEQQARERAARLLQKTLAEFGDRDQSVAYVMHGDFKRIFLEAAFGAESPPMGWRGIFNTSVTRIEFHSAPRLVFYNSIVHLTPEMVSK